MATRSNLRVIGKETKVWIYRHWDGSPAGNGADLAKALKKSAKWKGAREDQFLNTILALRSEQQSYETEPRRIYEVTTGEHGDIEWLYILKFTAKRVTVEVRERRLLEDKWVGHGILSEGEFRAFVTQDIRAMRKRVQALKRRHAA
jgi:hypothetical protein